MKSKETRTANIELLDDSIVKITMKNNVILEYEDSLENYNSYFDLLNGRKAVFLVVFPTLVSSSFKARESFKSSERNKIKIAEAIVIKNFGQEFELKDFQKKAKLSYPQRAFKNEKSAIKWLNTFL